MQSSIARMLQIGPLVFFTSLFKMTLSGCRYLNEMGVKFTVFRNNHSLGYCKSGNFCGTFIFTLSVLNLSYHENKSTQNINSSTRYSNIFLMREIKNPQTLENVTIAQKITPAKISTFTVHRYILLCSTMTMYS